ncbi:MAG: YgeY family selenium metabolism-linked hydrolase [Oscillibacter sp.]|nr:YgeY family selenium metabolism-linked hydrolase [Oscillibacter sp.]
MIAKEMQEEVLALARALVAQSSVSGQEGGAAEVLRRDLLSHGFDRAEIDRYGSVVGYLKGKRPGPRVLFDGHIDTVPVVRKNWTHDPYAGEIENGRLYGRGTSDMKGAVAAFAVAACHFAAACGREFAGEIAVAGVVHEECFEGVAARAISAAVKPDVVIIGEASECNVKIGQRGRAEIVVETFGVPAHSANPEKGVNAVYAMCRAVEAIRSLPMEEHPVLGKGILELTDIKSAPNPGASVVPAYCRATFDRRLLVGETRESVLAPIQGYLDLLAAEDPTFRYQVSYAVGEERCYTGRTIRGTRFFPGWLYDESEPFVQSVLRELRAIGQTPRVTQYSFCTNGSHYAGEAGIPTLGIGPSREDLAHTDDEYIELSELYKVTESYGAVLRALLK